MFEVSEIDNVYVFKFPSQYQLTSTFIRLQEYYESDFPSIRGHYFDLEDYMDEYANQFGNFTYFQDWSGMNVPSHVVHEWTLDFQGRFSKKEQELVNALEIPLKKYLEEDVRFYIIRIYDSKKSQQTLKHEMCHALYFLNEEYRSVSQKNVDGFRYKYEMYVGLNKIGYTQDVFDDEIQAFLTSYSVNDLKLLFGLDFDSNDLVNFKNTFRKYSNKKYSNIL